LERGVKRSPTEFVVKGANPKTHGRRGSLSRTKKRGRVGNLRKQFTTILQSWQKKFLGNLPVGLPFEGSQASSRAAQTEGPTSTNPRGKQVRTKKKGNKEKERSSFEVYSKRIMSSG